MNLETKPQPQNLNQTEIASPVVDPQTPAANPIQAKPESPSAEEPRSALPSAQPPTQSAQQSSQPFSSSYGRNHSSRNPSGQANRGFVPLTRAGRRQTLEEKREANRQALRKPLPQTDSNRSSGLPILGAKHKPLRSRLGRPLPETRHEKIWDQSRAPLVEALETYRRSRIVSFDVPGHKQGKGNRALVDFLGETCVSIDVNSMKPLDNLIHPVSVIREAEELAAQAFGAAHAFFMVGGTSSSVQTMVLTACQAGEKLILPRNVHRSALNALILSGAVPVYVDPGTNTELGIPLGMDADKVAEAIRKHPDAKAVLVNNPTYYGVCSNLKRIVEMAHEAGMLVLADEAHGTHLYFGESLPVPAIAAGADLAAVSLHKTGGSLTQSSILLLGPACNPGQVRQIINLTQTTSASYLLLSSLDLTRRNLALNGHEIFRKVVQMADYARTETNAIGGYYAFGRECCDQKAFFDFDPTKLSIHTRSIGLAGIEVYDLLRDEYGIQIEFGDIGNMLAILSVGDRYMEIERLIAALGEIKRRYAGDPIGMLANEYIEPTVVTTPREAFYSPKETLPLEASVGRVCGEFVMCYPPGIPIVAPGERITAEALEYILYAKAHGCSMTGTRDLTVSSIQVLLDRDPSPASPS